MSPAPHPTRSRRRHAAGARLTAGTACALALAAGSAGAQSTATFDGLMPGDAGVQYVANCYTEAQLTFTVVGVACGTSDAFATWGAADPLFYTGSPALFNNSIASASVDITAADGGAFSLLSIDLAPVLGAFGNPTTVVFEGMLRDGGSVSQTLMVPGGTNALTTYTFAGFTNLNSARLTVTDPSFEPSVQMDNIRTMSVSTVPEPGTVLLLGSGLAALGLMAHRRRRRS